ncbi:hypothetical protein P7K49_039635, partial [Saguinus oedipus]
MTSGGSKLSRNKAYKEKAVPPLWASLLHGLPQQGPQREDAQLEAVSSRGHPVAVDEGSSTDVPASIEYTGLPWPLLRHYPLATKYLPGGHPGGIPAESGLPTCCGDTQPQGACMKDARPWFP